MVSCLNKGVEVLVVADELLNKSVENKGVVLFELVGNFVAPAGLEENKSNGISIFGVAFLLISFSGEVANED